MHFLHVPLATVRTVPQRHFLKLWYRYLCTHLLPVWIPRYVLVRWSTGTGTYEHTSRAICHSLLGLSDDTTMHWPPHDPLVHGKFLIVLWLLSTAFTVLIVVCLPCEIYTSDSAIAVHCLSSSLSRLLSCLYLLPVCSLVMFFAYACDVIDISDSNCFDSDCYCYRTCCLVLLLRAK